MRSTTLLTLATVVVALPIERTAAPSGLQWRPASGGAADGFIEAVLPPNRDVVAGGVGESERCVASGEPGAATAGRATSGDAWHRQGCGR